MALWKEEYVNKLLDIGVALSAEQDINKLFELILSNVMELTNCDAGTLYLLREDGLHFRIMRNNTMQTYQGGDGIEPNLPPVALTRQSVCAISVIEDKTIVIDDVRHCDEYDLTGPIKYDSITGYFTKSMLVVPMKNRSGEMLGVLQLINAQDKEGNIIPFSKDIVRTIESVGSQAAVTYQNARYVLEIKDLFWSFVQMVSAAVDERTPYNLSHSRHMAEYGERFIDYLNEVAEEKTGEREFSASHKEEILMSIWLHDVGKLVTPLEVMNKEKRIEGLPLSDLNHRLEVIKLKAEIAYLKQELTSEEFDFVSSQVDESMEYIKTANGAGFLRDELMEQLDRINGYSFRGEKFITESEYALLSIRKGTLSDDERKIMEGHVVITKKLLSNIKFTSDYANVCRWASMHHEFLNGFGYPEKLSGDEIPREVRIITILDIFDALVADDRPYKPGMPIEKALSIISDMAHKEGKLDEELVELFISSRCYMANEKDTNAA